MKKFYVLLYFTFLIAITSSQTAYAQCTGCDGTNNSTSPIFAANETRCFTTGTTSISSDITFGDGGSICVASDAVLNLGANNYSTSGSGTFTIYVEGTLNVQQNTTWAGDMDITIAPGGLMTTKTLTLNGDVMNITNNGTFKPETLQFSNSNAVITIENNSNMTVSNNLNISSGKAQFINSGNLTVSGNYNSNSISSYINCGIYSGKFNLNGGGQVINTGTFNTGQIDYGGDTSKVSNYGTFNITGNVNLGNGGTFYNQGVVITSGSGVFSSTGNFVGPSDSSLQGYFEFESLSSVNEGNIGPNLNFTSTSLGSGTDEIGDLFQNYGNLNVDSSVVFGGVAPTIEPTNCPTADGGVIYSGTVYNDTNDNGTVDGTGIGSPGSTQLYVNVVDSTGNVVATAAVASDGTYTVTLDDALVDYTFELSTSQGTEDSPAPTNELPSNWEYTNEGGVVDGSLNVPSLTAGSIDFGIKETVDPCTDPAGIDTDGDGINDICDLDDDNDGIPDILEDSCDDSSKVDYNVVYSEDFGTGAGRFEDSAVLNHTFKSSGPIGDGSYAVVTSNTEGLSQYNRTDKNGNVDANIDDVDGPADGSTDGRYLAINMNGNGNSSYTGPSTFEFYRKEGLTTEAGLNYRFRVDLAGLCNGCDDIPKFTLQIQDSNGTVLASATSEDIGVVNDDLWRRTTLDFKATTASVDIVLINSQPNGGAGNDVGVDNIVLASIVCDTDRDGIPDHLDLDSDNDGCPDAIEADGSITNDDLNSNGSINGTVDANGVPTAVSGGQDTTTAVLTSDVINSIVIAPSTPEVCVDSNITLEATIEGKRVTDFGASGLEDDDTTIDIPEADYTYQWYLGTTELTDTAPYSGTSTASLTITETPEGFDENEYRVEVTTSNNSCGAEESITLSVNDLPTAATISASSSVCSGEDAVFTIEGAAGDIVTYTGAKGLPSSPVTIGEDGTVQVTVSEITADTTLNLTNVNNGTCYLALTDVSATVTVNTLPIANAGEDATLDCTTTSVMLGTASQAGYSYEWSPATGLDDTAAAQPEATPSETTTYTLVVTNTTTGCVSTSDSVTITVECSQISLEKDGVYEDTDGDSMVSVGDIIKYTFSVENTGNVTVSALTIDDTTIGITGLAVTPSTLAAGETGTASLDYAITAADIAAGSVSNTATAKGTDPDGDPVTDDSEDPTPLDPNDPAYDSSCPDCTVTPLEQTPMISLEKDGVYEDTDGDSMVSVGDIIKYTFSVENTGNVTVSALTIDDTTIGITGLAVTPSTLAAGETGTASLDYAITAADIAAGSVSNTATAKGTDPDGDPVTDDSEDPTPLDPNDPAYDSSCPDCTVTPLEQTPMISLEKDGVYEDTDGDSMVSVGDIIKYTFSVENTGNVTVSALTIDDTTIGITGLAVTPSTLAAGETGTASLDYAITAADIAAGSVSNTATAKGTDPDGDPVTDDSEDPTPLDPNDPAYDSSCPDCTVTPLEQTPMISLEKDGVYEDTDGDSMVSVGDIIKYTFSVENTGNVTVSALTIDDTTIGITGLAVTPSTLAAGETGTASLDYAITAADIAAGSVSNTATAKGTDPDGDPVTDDSEDPTPLDPNDPAYDSSCPDCTVTPLEQTPMISLEKDGVYEDTDGDSMVSVGDIIKYTFSVENTGNVTVSALTIDDTTIGITGLAVTPSTLAAGETGTASLDYAITAADIAAGSVSNTATAKGTDPDGDPVTDDSEDPTPLDPNDPAYDSSCPDCTVTPLEQTPMISLEKDGVYEDTDGDSMVSVGDIIKYTFSVENTGNVTVSALTIDDTTIGITGLAVTPSTLAAGETGTASLDYAITAADIAAGSVSNTATAKGTDPDGDPVTDDSEDPTPLDPNDPAYDSSCPDCTVTPLEQTPMISLEKDGVYEDTDGDSMVSVGDIIKYTFSVENTGNVTVSALTIDDTTIGITGLAVTPSTLAAGETGTASLDYAITAADIAAGSVSNTATAKGTDPDGDPVTDDSEDPTPLDPNDPAYDSSCPDCTVTPLEQTPMISLEKDGVYEDTDGDSMVSVGDIIKYTFSVENTGNVTVSALTIDDTTIGITGLAVTPSTLAAGETGTASLDYAITAADIAAGSVSNTATAKGTDPDGDPVTDDSEDPTPLDPNDPAYDSSCPDCTVTPLEQTPMISLEKDGVYEDTDGDSMVSVGDIIKYTFSVENTGNVTVSALTIDDTTIGITGLAVTPSTLAAGETGTASLDYAITAADIAAGSVSNTATAKGTDPDGDPVTDDSEDPTPLDPNDPAYDSSCPDCTVTPLEQTPMISLEKDGVYEDTDGDSMVSVGDIIKYTFSVENTGNVTVSALTIDDTTIGITGLAVTPSTLAAGETGTASLDYAITAADIAAGSVSNTATAKGTDPDGDPVTDDSEDPTPLDPNDPAYDSSCPDCTVTPLEQTPMISLEKDGVYEDTDGDSMVSVGDIIKYTFSVENTGNVTVSALTIDDTTIGITGLAVTPSTLAAGETGTASLDYAITAADIAAGSVSNTATAKGTDPDGDPVTDDSEDPTPLDPNDPAYDSSCPDCTVTPLEQTPMISLEKDGVYEDTDGDSMVSVGDIIKYTFSVENTGNVTVSALTIDDTTIGITGLAVTPSTLAAGETGTASLDYAITAADIAAGSVSNTATAKGTDPDGDPVTDDSEDPTPLDPNDPAYDSSCPDCTVTPLEQTPMISLEKDGVYEDTDGDSMVSVGDIIKYTFSVENTGNVTVSALTIDDTTIGITGLAVTPSTLAAGETGTASLDYAITAADIAAGSVSNTATAKGTDPDGDPVTDDSEDPTPLDPNDPAYDSSCPDCTVTPLEQTPMISLEKDGVYEDTDGDSMVSVGDIIKYTFSVENTGNVTVSALTIDDTTIGITGLAVTPSTLAAGETGTASLDYAITAADIAAGSVSNTATAKGTDPDGDPVTDDSEDPTPLDPNDPAYDSSCPDCTVTPLEQTPMISLEKDGVYEDTDGDSMVSVGDIIKYTFSVENTGNVTVSALTIDDTTIGITGLAVTPSTLAAGETGTASLDYAITAADIAAGSVSNTATAKGTDPDGDPVTDDSEDPTPLDPNDPAYDSSCPDCTVTPLEQTPMISLEKDGVYVDTNNDGITNVGDEVHYVFTVVNTGNVTVTGITVTDDNATVTGGSIDLVPGATDSTTFTAVHTLTQTDINTGYVYNIATATGKDPSGDPVTDESEDPTPADPSDPGYDAGCPNCTVVEIPNTTNAINDINNTFVDVPVDGNVLTNDFDLEGNAQEVTLNTEPTSGRVVVSTDGSYTYTPDPGFIGTDTFSYTICDDGIPEACDSATVTVEVLEDPYADINEVVANNDTATTEEDQPVEGNLLSNDFDPEGDELIVNETPVTGPTNGSVTIDPNGTFVYTPNPGFEGEDTFVYEVCDDGTPSVCDEATVTIIVNPDNGVNDTYANDDAYNGNPNKDITGSLLDNDTDPEGYVLEVVTLISGVDPSEGALTLRSDGTFTFIPARGFKGATSFVYEVCDGDTPQACDKATVYLTVNPINNTYAINDINNTFVDTSVAGNVLTNDFDPEGDSVSVNPYDGVTTEGGTVIMNTDGSYIYTPGLGFIGEDTFSYTICDDGIPEACDTATVTITVIDTILGLENNPPVANDDTAITEVGVEVEIHVISNDFDPDSEDTITVTPGSVTTPVNGSVIDNGDGTFTYTPNADFEGKDSFTYQICDDGTPSLCDTATVTVTVLPDDGGDNDTYANDDTYNGDPETIISGNVVDNDTDPEGDEQTVTTVPVVDVSNGTLVLNGDGTFEYTPDEDFVGTDSFVYEVCDTGSPQVCDQATVYLTVNIPNSYAELAIEKEISVPANGVNHIVGEEITFTITLVNNGPGNATGIDVVDQLPSGYSLSTVTAPVASIGTTYDSDSGLWAVGDLTVYDNTDAASIAATTATLTVTAIINESGNYTNIAEVTDADQKDPNGVVHGNNTPGEIDQDEVTIVPTAITDLVTTKVVDNATPNTGDTITYTLTVVNNGPSVATEVSLIDNLPAGLEYVTHIATGGSVNTYADVAGDMTWSIGKIDIGESATLTIDALVTAQGTLAQTPITNITTPASGDQLDPTTDGDDLEENIIVTSSDLVTVKTVSDPTPNEGDTITYSIAVTNNGPSDATDVSLTDLLPAGVTYVSDDQSGAYNRGSGIWTVGAIANGATVTLNITATVDIDTAGETITNITTAATGDQSDPTTEGDDLEATIEVENYADIVLTKVVDNATPNVGDTVTYTVTVTNNGPAKVTGLVVTDALPTGLTYGIVSPSDGTWTAPNWSIDLLESGEEETIVIEAVVGMDQGGMTLTNVVSNTQDQVDSDLTEDDDRETIVVTSSDLVTVKTVSDPTPNEGDTITYSIAVTNNGPSDATGVSLTDLLPAGVTYVSDDQSGAYNSGSGIWTVGAIANGATATLNITATVNVDTTGETITNITTAATGDQSDPTTEGDDLEAIIKVENYSDIVLTKVVDNETPNAGDIVTYTVTVRNNGPAKVTNLVVTDVLPAGLTYTANVMPSDGVWTAPTWNIDLLESGEEESIVLEVLVGMDQGGVTLTNVVSNTQDQVDANLTEDDDNATIVVTSSDLATVKTVSNATPNEGDIITYTITVTNNGPSAATGVSLVDKLPVGVTFVSSSTEAYNYGSGLWNIGTIANGATVTLNITATVNDGTLGQTITNTTSELIADQTDSDTTNNVGSASIVPTAYIDLSLTKWVVNDVVNPEVGDMITFEIRVENDGPTMATGVQVTDLIPSGYDFVNYSPSIGTYDDESGIWDIGFIEVGNTAVLLIDVIVNDSGDYINIAEITAANEIDIDSTPNNGDVNEDDYDSASAPPYQELDLRVEKTVMANNLEPLVGDEVSFEIRLINDGNIDGTEVVVADLLPTGYTYVTHGLSKGVYDYETGNWIVGTILNGETETLFIDAIVNATGDYLNCATITAMHQTDPDLSNNTSCIATDPIKVVDLELTKEVALSLGNQGPVSTTGVLQPYAETNVDFTITVTNNGLSDATGVQVQDQLPSGYNFVNVTVSTGSYDDGSGIWNVGTIANGASETMVITAYVNPLGDWLNVAEVISVNELDLDSTPGNGDIFEDDMDEIATDPIIQLTIPEGFTPNGDGINDVFEIEHLEVLYPNFSMEIVNRYGNKVYDYKHNGDPYQTPTWWDGYSTGRWNFSSDMLPTGTYFYTIYFNNDERKPQTGWIYLRK
ncbi:Ig-like domain-containing protein [Lutibacter sp. A64]|uniref:DUF7507 domain-containing protein n=1 Tax=Lutibacter sp. A64 TaxID=2918526 RepID=UPI001F069A43|nr:Ig-like domain-containing protein [Lutibacter sp. A64]UMB53397.1 Ig-like domain-containing protein [Lutibacter sp. A64]